jgi:hypothetical protein
VVNVVNLIRETRRQGGILIDGVGNQSGTRRCIAFVEQNNENGGIQNIKEVVSISVTKRGSLPSWRHYGFIKMLKAGE